jgi:hypothetical protein
MDMMWINNLSLIFDYLKRLNGVYILIFIVTGKQFRNLFVKKYPNLSLNWIGLKSINFHSGGFSSNASQSTNVSQENSMDKN